MVNNNDIIKQFCKDCVWVWVVHNHYSKLYERGKLRLDLLDQIATTFFHDLQIILIDYLFMQICKLTDPAKTFGKYANLTTNYIIEYLDWDSKVENELKEINSNLMTFRAYIEEARRKIIAHTDLKTIMSGKPLGAFPEDEEKDFFKNLQSFVDVIHRNSIGGPCSIEAVVFNDAEDLIESLKQSVDYDDYFEDKQREKFDRRQNMKFSDA